MAAVALQKPDHGPCRTRDPQERIRMRNAYSRACSQNTQVLPPSARPRPPAPASSPFPTVNLRVSESM
eukprot:2610704-Rhodomonas_salina.3